MPTATLSTDVSTFALIPQTLQKLRLWIESREFAGHEPYDILNSPYLRGAWARKPPLSFALIQFAKRLGGLRLRKVMAVPASRNPKALGLCLSAYCDLARTGWDVESEIDQLKTELIKLRSPGESEYCWGYDWDYMSLRGTAMPAFSPNCIASYFCGSAMMDIAEQSGDQQSGAIGESVARFFVTRLNRSIETDKHICFSYTPRDKTLIYNSSVLAGAYLTRVGLIDGNAEYLSLARRAMAFLCDNQLPEGGWYYGALRKQHWIDGFHTSYNICALLDYIRLSGDASFEEAIRLGHAYYKRTFFTPDGAPKYFHNRLYPIDIHSCSQAILHFCAFAERDAEAMDRALQVFTWTVTNMGADDGSFYYQKHRIWTDRTPYLRWGQAWMFRALAKLLFKASYSGNETASKVL